MTQTRSAWKLTLIVVFSILGTFILAQWLVRTWTRPTTIDITVSPSTIPLHSQAQATLSVHLYNQFGWELASKPQIAIEIIEGRDCITIDTVYPGGAILRPADRTGIARLHVWVEGFPFPSEVRITIVPLGQS